MRKRLNQVSIIVAEAEEGGEFRAFLWFRPLSDFVELCRIGVDAVLGHDLAKVVNSLREMKAL